MKNAVRYWAASNTTGLPSIRLAIQFTSSDLIVEHNILLIYNADFFKNFKTHQADNLLSDGYLGRFTELKIAGA